MRTETIKIYKFEELKPEIQAKVLEKQRNYAYEDQWTYENIMDWISENLEEQGFPINKDLYWSFEGYKSETGIGFKGIFDFEEYIDWKIKNFEGTKDQERQEEVEEYKTAKKKYSPLFNNLRSSIRIETYDYNRQVYYKEWELDFTEVDNMIEQWEYEDEDENKESLEIEIFKTLYEEFKEWLQTEVINTQKRTEKAMKEDLEYFLSDEALKEDIEANQYEYLENGDRA